MGFKVGDWVKTDLGVVGRVVEFVGNEVVIEDEDSELEDNRLIYNQSEVHPVTFNHAFTVSFTIDKSSDRDGLDVSGARLRQALQSILERYSDEELQEICEVYDTFEEEED